MHEIALFYIPCPGALYAQKLADHLLEKHLIACSNVFAITSNYWWDEAIEKENEYVCLVKTTLPCAQHVVDEIEKIHPYKVPCIMQMNATVNSTYFEWMLESITKN